MINIDRQAAHESGKNLIPIRNASRSYEPDFYLEDGKSITITGPEGSKDTISCKFLDDHHFMLGSTCYHVDQFAELVQRNHLRCEPEEYVTDLDLYRKVYLDRALKDQNGKLIPYRGIVSEVEGVNKDKIIAVCPNTIIDRKVGILERNGNDRTISFCSIDQAMTDMVPQLNLPEIQKNLLHKVLFDIGKEIPRISEQDFEAIPKDYKGTYSDFNGQHPEWKGKRTAFLPGHGTTLFIEGVSFIIEKGRKPSLQDQVKAAAIKAETSQKEESCRTGLNHDR